MGIIRKIIELFPYRIQRKIEVFAATSIVAIAATPGKLKLSRTGGLKILVDNSVFWHGLTHTNAWISTGTVLWGGKIPVETGHTARVPIGYKKHNRNIYEKEVPYFPAISKLAKDGNIFLFTSRELLAERWRHGSYDPYVHGLNIWTHTPIDTLPEYVDDNKRKYIARIMDRYYFSKEGQIDRIKMTAPDSFLKMVQGIGDENFLDIFHLWVANENDCDIFLTTDFKFIRFYNNQVSNFFKKRINKTKIMTPNEFGISLGLFPVPMEHITPLYSDWFYESRKPEIEN